jgi:hypothetical protein
METARVEGGPPIAARAPIEEVNVVHADPLELPSKKKLVMNSLPVYRLLT